MTPHLLFSERSVKILSYLTLMRYSTQDEGGRAKGFAQKEKT